MPTKKELSTDYSELILLLPLATRSSVSDKIVRLSAHFGVKEDLTTDQRKKSWTQKPRKTSFYGYEISIRGGDGWFIEHLEDAAKFVSLKPQSLKVYLDRNSDGPNTFCKVIDDQIITVVRHKLEHGQEVTFETLPEPPKNRY